MTQEITSETFKQRASFTAIWINFRLKYVIGKNDEYIDEEKILNERKKLDNYGLDYDFYLFDGGHNIESSTLKKLI